MSLVNGRAYSFPGMDMSLVRCVLNLMLDYRSRYPQLSLWRNLLVCVCSSPHLLKT